ncbi:MAG: hypothetical protein RLN62_00960 [Rickettsiales bacterium]
MGKAKTASKNNPTARAKAKVFKYNNQVVKPVKLISHGRNYMAVQYEGGQVAVDEKGSPVPWGKIRGQ